MLFVNNVALKARPDVMSLALLNMPKGRGKKRTKLTLQWEHGPMWMKHPMVKGYNDLSAALPIEQLTGQQATRQQTAGQQPTGQCGQAPAGQHGEQPSYNSNQKLPEPLAFLRPPLHLVIVGKVRGEYIQEGEKKTGKESDVYFHPLRECVNRWAPMFIPSLLTLHPADITETFFVQDHNDFIGDKRGP